MLATSTEIERVVRETVARFRPQKIILFGSYAYGQPHEGSDLDLLDIIPNPPPSNERSDAMWELRRHCARPLQIVFMNPEEFEETKDVIGGVAYPACQWGTVLYEANLISCDPGSDSEKRLIENGRTTIATF